jgi:AAA+ superfamily predicted ATPase
MTDRTLLEGMRTAVEADPGNLALRLHYAELLAAADQRNESVRQAAAVLAIDPTNAVALALISPPPAVAPPRPESPRAEAESEAGELFDPPLSDAETLAALEQELAGTVPPRFEEDEEIAGLGAERRDRPPPDAFDVQSAELRLADVGGMETVKTRLEAAFLAPMRNPELQRLYGKSLGGGLLLYGPPGCGKTFIARALAGEIGAQFIAVSLADVLDMYIGQSERNVHELFELARRHSPCVIFLDEVDAVGHKRSQMRNSAARGAVNQLLTEMDGVADANDQVFVLGATNHPWDVDVALRRPGRFDRMLLVLPPDDRARAAILELHLRGRPIERINVAKLVKRTAGFSGADLKHLIDAAAERALLDSVATHTVRMITMADFDAVLGEVKPSVGPWFETARNVAEFGNTDGSYDELLAYLRKRRP